MRNLCAGRVFWQILSRIFLLNSMIVKVNAWTPRFTSWFPLRSKQTYQSISEITCNATLLDYRNSLTRTDKPLEVATCISHQNCILRALREDLALRISSASVLLGLTPSLLASISPSVSEMVILSACYPPIFTLLITLGCPTVYQSRPLDYEDPKAIVEIKPFKRIHGLLRKTVLYRVAPLFKYIILCICASNMMYTSWQLTTKTILSFRCVNDNLVMIWTLLPILIHLCAAIPYYNRDSFKRSYVERAKILKRIKRTNWSGNLIHLSTTLGFLHLVFGSLIFSSLIFIEIIDIVVIILRYMASAFTARMVLMYELDELRIYLQQPEEKVNELSDIKSTCKTRV